MNGKDDYRGYTRMNREGWAKGGTEGLDEVDVNADEKKTLRG